MGNGFMHGGSTVQESSWLVFMGTGLAGLAGVVRKKLRSALSGEALYATRSPSVKTSLNKGFLGLYHASLDNATDLLAESENLFDTEKYARAYALAFTALEEIYKSQLAADVFTALITE